MIPDINRCRHSSRKAVEALLVTDFLRQWINLNPCWTLQMRANYLKERWQCDCLGKYEQTNRKKGFLIFIRKRHGQLYSHFYPMVKVVQEYSSCCRMKPSRLVEDWWIFHSFISIKRFCGRTFSGCFSLKSIAASAKPTNFGRGLPNISWKLIQGHYFQLFLSSPQWNAINAVDVIPFWGHHEH